MDKGLARRLIGDFAEGFRTSKSVGDLPNDGDYPQGQLSLVRELFRDVGELSYVIVSPFYKISSRIKSL
tara:strand:- start:1713 stop:1919 length:207 start_codon:yes stop_codon:yes gene_type:complete